MIQDSGFHDDADSQAYSVIRLGDDAWSGSVEKAFRRKQLALEQFTVAGN
jgi:hypothetical protein